MKFPSGSPVRPIDRFISRIESIPGSDRFILRFAFFAVVISTIWLLFSLNQQYSEVTAVRGGSITEGIIGTPRFVNPALALTRADQDITALIYSGLLKIDSDGQLTNDAAESVTVSDDGLTYNIVLKQGTKFHDGEPLTARDFIYTVQLIQDPDLKSPLRGNWSDVTLEEIGEYELNVVLTEAYAPFIENFTLGIMPAHAWSSLPIEQLPFSQLNTEPIGSGPFEVTDAKRDTSGLINHYTLSAFRDNEVNTKINKFELAFFQNELALQTALTEHKIDATAYISPEFIASVAKDGYQLIEQPIPRTFGIFLNQNKTLALRDASAREALTAAIDRDALIEKALSGHGIPIYGPIALDPAELESLDSTDNESTSTPAIRAKQILKDGGWIINNGLYEKKIDGDTATLSVVLRTSNSPLFQTLVTAIAEQWEAAGIVVTTEQFEQTGLIQSVIRPRDFQALLFGLDMNRTNDLYPFWHSSQQNDPGLNIAQYANVTVDALLETARLEQDAQARNESLIEASEIIVEEAPAIFLFQPTLTYIVSDNVSLELSTNLGRASDRFTNIADWHTESDTLWPFFQKDL